MTILLTYLLTYLLNCYYQEIIITSIEENLFLPVISNCTKSLENVNPIIVFCLSVCFYTCACMAYRRWFGLHLIMQSDFSFLSACRSTISPM